MELKLGIEVLDSYKRLSYRVWYALAEFIDNSTQSYQNYAVILDDVYKQESSGLSVSISYRNGNDGYIVIQDNSIGMDESDLESAMTIGKKPTNTAGRSKYGLGLKTASFWFGDKWEIITKKYGHPYEYHLTVDLGEILRQENQTSEQSNSENALAGSELVRLDNNEVVEVSSQLIFERKDKPQNEHYTIVRISKLNRQIHSATARKTKDYLRSIYRYDLQNGKLSLQFQGSDLTWSAEEFQRRMLKDEAGMPYHLNFDFEINGKRVRGWAGVLERGSRRDAGFSILQANRVIQGWPESYRPEKLFGSQEGGTNNLVNQRLFGELFLDGFEVSHTKDEILFTDDEEEILDQKLFDTLQHLKIAAEEYRKPTEPTDEALIDFKGIVTDIFKTVQEHRFRAAVFEAPVLPAEIIESSNDEFVERTLHQEIRDTYEVEINGLKITVIINTDGSLYDPYLVIRSRAKREEVTIVINKNHKHWDKLNSSELVIYFIKQCIYDGIAEWKANFIAGSIDPDTIKMIKDSYLRLDLEI